MYPPPLTENETRDLMIKKELPYTQPVYLGPKAQLLELGLCEQCCAIDIPQHYQRLSEYGQDGFNVKYTPDLDTAPTCPLCRMLYNIVISNFWDSNMRIIGVAATKYYEMKEKVNSPLALAKWYYNIPMEETLEIPARGLIIVQPTRAIPSDRTPWIEVSRVNQAQVDYSLLRSWFLACDHLHSDTCGRRPDSLALSIPLRCIDCYTRNIVQIQDDAYIALSYVWGDIAEKPVRNERFEYNTVVGVHCPKVVEDAMTLVIRLGKTYLWVDQFCIDQQDQWSKAAQIGEMDKIYAGAYATIVACAGEDAEYGLAGVSRPRAHKHQVITIGDWNFCHTMPELSYAISLSAWQSRGWTYQEAVLSRRCIFLTDYQVYFVCQSMTCRESVIFAHEDEAQRHGLHHRGNSSARAIFGNEPDGEPGEPHVDLMHHIIEYSCRRLKYDEDGLNAFRGLLSRTPVFTFYGIPLAASSLQVSSDFDIGFAAGLTWAPKLPNMRRFKRRPQFPSWSWVGWKGGIEYSFLLPFLPAPMSAKSYARTHVVLAPPRFWLEDDTGLHTLQDITSTLSGMNTIPEQGYQLIIETEVLSFTFQQTVHGWLGWCACHPHASHEGELELGQTPGGLSRPWFYGRQRTNANILAEPWDCLLLYETSSNHGGEVSVLQYLMIVEWVDSTAYRVGHLMIFRGGEQDPGQRTRRRIRLG